MASKSSPIPLDKVHPDEADLPEWARDRFKNYRTALAAIGDVTRHVITAKPITVTISRTDDDPASGLNSKDLCGADFYGTDAERKFADAAEAARRENEEGGGALWRAAMAGDDSDDPLPFPHYREHQD